MADVDLVATDASRFHAASRERDHLGVGDRSGRADQLRADLVSLAPVLKAAFLGRDNGSRVAEPQRQGSGAQLSGDQARDRHGPLADQRDHVAASVGELEKAPALLDAKPEVEHVHRLDKRGDDVAVAPTSHLGQQRFLRLTQDLRFQREEVSEAWNAAELELNWGLSPGEGTSGPWPREKPCGQLSSSSSSSVSPSASSEKSIASASSSTACIPSSISSLAGVSAAVSSSSSSPVKTSTPRVIRLSFV